MNASPASDAPLFIREKCRALRVSALYRVKEVW